MLTNSLKLKSTEWKPRHIISTDLYCIRMQSTLLLLLKKKKKSQKKVLCVSRKCHPSALLPLGVVSDNTLTHRATAEHGGSPQS